MVKGGGKSIVLYIVIVITFLIAILGVFFIYNFLKEKSSEQIGEEKTGEEGGQTLAGEEGAGGEVAGEGAGGGGGNGGGGAGGSTGGSGEGVVYATDITICQNAQNGNLCGGLDISYGEGYRALCCSEHSLCC